MYRSNSFDENHFAVTALNVGAGTATFLIKRHDQIIDYAPDQIFSRHQITMSGLDGGTYEVSGLAPTGVQFVNQAGPLLDETDTATIEAISVQLRVSVVGGGGAFSPVLHLTSLPRMS
jgi:hypothetical protein